MAVDPDRHTFEETLSCNVVPERDQVRVLPAGSLDMATVGILEAQLLELRAAGFEKVTLDLSALDFMDSTGLRLMLRWDAAARSDGFALAVVPGSPTIQRVFELTGTQHRIPFIEE